MLFLCFSKKREDWENIDNVWNVLWVLWVENLKGRNFELLAESPKAFVAFYIDLFYDKWMETKDLFKYMQLTINPLKETGLNINLKFPAAFLSLTHILSLFLLRISSNR